MATSSAPTSGRRTTLSRRQAVVGGVVGAATAAAAAGVLTKNHSSPVAPAETGKVTSSSTRMPLAYVPHGGGPFSYVDMGRPASEVDALVDYWRSLGSLCAETPRALLVLSAHWECPVPTVMSAAQPPLLFDYYGFPQASYELAWPAPGAPVLAARIQSLLAGAGLDTAEDGDRGFDHGTFIPFGRSFPEAQIPTLQLSLKQGLDPLEHLAIGRALMPLRDEGVFILGSGMSYHNMRGFRSAAANEDAEEFDVWLSKSVGLPATERDAELARWQQAPAARRVHPREEHLIPLMVLAGAAGEDVGRVAWSGHVFDKRVSAIHFGESQKKTG